MSQQLLYQFKSKSTSLFAQNRNPKQQRNCDSTQLRYPSMIHDQQLMKRMDSQYTHRVKNHFKKESKKLQQKVETIDRWKQKYASNSQPKQQIFHRNQYKLPAIKSNRHLSRQIIHNQEQQNVLKDLGIMKVRISQTIPTKKTKKTLMLIQNSQRSKKKQINMLKNILQQERSENQARQQELKIRKQQKIRQNQQQIVKTKTNLILSRILEGNPQRWEIFNQQQVQLDHM